MESSSQSSVSGSITASAASSSNIITSNSNSSSNHNNQAMSSPSSSDLLPPSLNRGISVDSTDENDRETMTMERLDQQDEPPLLPGEHIVNNIRNREVTYICPFFGPIRGSLSVTNYKLYFKSASDQSPSGIFVIDVPLCCLSRIEKVGGAMSKGDHAYGIDLNCKDMRNIRLALKHGKNHTRRDVYDTLVLYAFKQQKLFAFEYKQIYEVNGWNVYKPLLEYERLGIPNDSWKLSKVNGDKYSLSDSYPAVLAVPSSASEDDLRAVAAFRSKGRIPVLSWIHPNSQAAIVRCSQPLVGVAGKKSAADEKYIQMIMDANAQSHKLYIMDARPQANAIANKARGGGYESEETYPNSELCFLDIQNIHVMRQAYMKLKDLCTGEVNDTNWYTHLEATHWLDYIRIILAGALRITDKIESSESSVIVHCSDGWDRTAQLTSLSMIMLDAYYRTLKGFQVLIEKEWLSFGHKFGHRIGHGDDKHADPERSPVFVQFIDCVYQLTLQFPHAFEFNEHFLITVLDHLYSCLFGTFLFNKESERVAERVQSQTVSLWSLINSHSDNFMNPLYSSHNDHVLLPAASLRRMVLWTNYYCRWNPLIPSPEPINKRQQELMLIKRQLEKRVEDLQREWQIKLGRSGAAAASSGGNTTASSGNTMNNTSSSTGTGTNPLATGSPVVPATPGNNPGNTSTGRIVTTPVISL